VADVPNHGRWLPDSAVFGGTANANRSLLKNFLKDFFVSRSDYLHVAPLFTHASVAVIDPLSVE
jgi:hypothetical protein